MLSARQRQRAGAIWWAVRGLCGAVERHRVTVSLLALWAWLVELHGGQSLFGCFDWRHPLATPPPSPPMAVACELCDDSVLWGIVAQARAGQRRFAVRRDVGPPPGQGPPPEDGGGEVAALERALLRGGDAGAAFHGERRFDALLALGALHASRFRYADARVAWRFATAELRDEGAFDAEAFEQGILRLAQTEFTAHLYEDAEHRLSSVLQEEPPRHAATRAEMLCTAGWAQAMQGDLAEASAAFAAALACAGDGWAAALAVGAGAGAGRDAAACRARGDGLDGGRALALGGLALARGPRAGAGRLGDCAARILAERARWAPRPGAAFLARHALHAVALAEVGRGRLAAARRHMWLAVRELSTPGAPAPRAPATAMLSFVASPCANGSAAFAAACSHWTLHAALVDVASGDSSAAAAAHVDALARALLRAVGGGADASADSDAGANAGADAGADAGAAGGAAPAPAGQQAVADVAAWLARTAQALAGLPGGARLAPILMERATRLFEGAGGPAGTNRLSKHLFEYGQMLCKAHPERSAEAHGVLARARDLLAAHGLAWSDDEAAELHTALGAAAQRAGRADDAVPSFRRAAELAEGLVGPRARRHDHLRLGAARGALGAALLRSARGCPKVLREALHEFRKGRRAMKLIGVGFEDPRVQALERDAARALRAAHACGALRACAPAGVELALGAQCPAP